MVAIDTTYGALFIGVVVAAILYGFTCVQTWYYYTHYPSDPWYNKIIVAVVFLSDTTHQILISHTVYIYVITNFGDYAELRRIVWSLIVEIHFNAFTTFFVQCFLAFRVYKLSNKNWYATTPVVVLIVAQFVTAVVLASKAINFATFAQLAVLSYLSKSVNVLAAVGDLLIAILLCSMLRASRTGFRSSDTLINKLVMFSINTGLLTSIFALASLISISVWPHSFAYIAFYFCIGRLYCNSLLATLNARRGLRNESRTADDSSVEMQSHRVSVRSKRIPNNISIKIDTTHECIRDEFSSSSGDVKNAVEAD